MSKSNSRETENRYLFTMTIIDPVIDKLKEEEDFLSLKEVIPFERVRRLQNGKEKVTEVLRAFTQNNSIDRNKKPEEAMLLDALQRKQESMRTNFFGGLWKISIPETDVIIRVHKEKDHYQRKWKEIQTYLSEVQRDIHQDTEYGKPEDRKKHGEWISDLLTDPDISFENCHSLEEVNQKMLAKTIEKEAPTKKIKL